MRRTFCNICGKELDTYDESNEYVFRHRMGYGSKHDGELIRIDMCSECVDELIDRCLIDPIEETN